MNNKWNIFTVNKENQNIIDNTNENEVLNHITFVNSANSVPPCKFFVTNNTANIRRIISNNREA